MSSEAALGTFLGQLVESTPDALLVIDEGGLIVHANRQCERLTGWGRDDLIGTTVDRLVPVGVRGDHHVLRARYTAGPTIRTMGAGLDLHLATQDGHEVPVDISLSPFAHDGSQFVAVAIRDVTERLRGTLAVRQAQEELERSVAELREQGHVLRLTNELGELLHSCENLDEGHEVMARFGPKLLPGSHGWVYRVDAASGDLELAHGWGERTGEEPVAAFGTTSCWALRRGSVHLSLDEGDVVCDHLRDADHSVCIPLLAHGELLGLVVAVLDPSRPVAPSFEQVVRSLAERVSFALSNILLRETLRRQSTRDPLTGLHNRRSLDEHLRREVARCSRTGLPLSLVAIDLDHFKAYNDTHGHALGDAALVAVAGLLEQQVRADDLACRQGGEEFLLVLAGAALEDAVRRADDLRDRCAALELGPDRGITMSVGVATFPTHGHTIDAALAAADGALYEAKATGRNRVASASG